jgi:Zn-dependent protease with chaperone function
MIGFGLNQTTQVFKACWIHPDLGKDGVEGTLSLDLRSVRFHSGSLRLEIPLEQVVLKLDRHGNRICFYDSDRPESGVQTADQSVLEHPIFTRSNSLRSQLSAIMSRRELVSRLRMVLYFAAGCVLLGCLASWATGAMVRVLADRVPLEWERKFGDAQIEKMRIKGLLVDNSNEVAQLTALAAPLMRVVPLGKTRVQFHIAENPVPNAFAIPGAHVVVNSGLLGMAEKPEEVLGVIAHELAHVTQKHHARQVISAAGPVLIFGVFMHTRENLVNVLSAGAGVMVFEGFSQDVEQEADDVGWKYLVAARIDPQGMTDMFRKLQVYEMMQETVKLPQAFNSHPRFEKRITRLQARGKNLRPKSGFLEFTNSMSILGPRPG